MRRQRALLLTVVLAFVALSAARGLRAELLLDEGYTLSLTDQQPAVIGHVVLNREMNGALHTLIVAVGGLDSPFGVRLVSLVAMALAAVVLADLLHRCFSSFTSALAGLLFFCTNQIVIENSTVARTYAVATMLAVVATDLLVRAADRPRRTALWCAWGIVLGLGVLAHLYVALLAMAHSLWLVLHHRARWRQWARGIPPALLLTTPVMAFVAVGGPSAGQLPDGPDPTARTLFSGLITLFAGQAERWPLVQILVLGALSTAALSGLLRSRLNPIAALGLLMTAVPVPLAAAATLASGDDFAAPRYLLICLPGAALLLAAAMQQLSRPGRQVAFAGLAAVLVVPLAQAGPPATGWENMARRLDQVTRAGDVVTTLAPFEQHTLQHYLDPHGLTAAPDIPHDGPGFLRATSYDSRPCPPTVPVDATMYVFSTMTRDYDRDVRTLAACAGRHAHRVAAPGGIGRLYRLPPTDG